MNLVRTTIKEKTLQMRYADDPDREKAELWIDFSVPVEDLRMPDPDGNIRLEDIPKRQLAIVQAAALRYVRKAIDEELKRLPR